MKCRLRCPFHGCLLESVSVADLDFCMDSIPVNRHSDCCLHIGSGSLLLFLSFDTDLAEVVRSVAEIADLSASGAGLVSEFV